MSSSAQEEAGAEQEKEPAVHGFRAKIGNGRENMEVESGDLGGNGRFAVASYFLVVEGVRVRLCCFGLWGRFCEKSMFI